ncbi:PAO [Symbiodinium natans]|uniref:PAO protein n=1 Tax=Symbiodinium natans TaxID=878477 RepID=A0A812NYK1_9DINO|nr:PAO [Symbiodinium natans]
MCPTCGLRIHEDAFTFLSLALETLRLRSMGLLAGPGPSDFTRLHHFIGPAFLACFPILSPWAPLVFFCMKVLVSEQLLILVLHALIMAGMSFQLELANDFWPELHCTRSAESSETAPNVWHEMARWTGTALVFFAAGVSIFFALGILGGYVYRFHGLLPARWATSLYKPDVRMTRFAAAPQSMSDYRHEFLPVDVMATETLSLSLLRPGLGIAASMGFWHQKMSYAFQVGRRLEWYLPALPDDTKTTAFTSDCVSWMTVARATVHNLSLAWLLLPFGGLPARASLYLNERN